MFYEEEEDEGEKTVYECPLCGAEVDGEGTYCEDCKENLEDDDY